MLLPGVPGGRGVEGPGPEPHRGGGEEVGPVQLQGNQVITIRVAQTQKPGLYISTPSIWLYSSHFF